MFIKRVVLNNIRSYTDQEILFNQGSTLLSGDIGSGKTTILLAIEFCLFGMRKDGLSGDTLLRNGANDGYVELDFALDGRNVLIKRVLKRYKDGVKQSSGYIISDGVRSDLTAQEIKARILDMLGYPPSLLSKSKNLMYRYTVYTQQEDMKQILLDDKDNRIDTLRRIFGIDRYKNMRENVLIYIRHLKNVKSRLEGRVDDLDEKLGSLKAKKTMLEKTQAALSKINKDIVDLDFESRKKQFIELESKLNNYNKLKNRLDVLAAKKHEKAAAAAKLADDMARLKSMISKDEEKLGSIKLEKPTLKSAEELDAFISENQKIITDISRNVNLKEEKLLHLRKAVLDLTKEIEQKSEKIKDFKFKKQSLDQLHIDLEEKPKVKSLISELNCKLEKLNAKLTELATNIKNSENLKKHISELDKCPTCLQTVSIDHKFAINQKEAANISKLAALTKSYDDEKRAQIKELEELAKKMEELLSKDNLYSKLSSDIRNLEDISAELARKQKLLDDANRDILKTNAELDDLRLADIAKLNAGIRDAKELLNKLNDHNLILKEKRYLEQQLSEKKASLQDIEKARTSACDDLNIIEISTRELGAEIRGYGSIEEHFVTEKAGYESLMNMQKDLLTQKAGIEKEHELLSGNIAELDKEVKEKESDKKKIEYYNQLQNWLEEYFIKLMSVIERNVMFSVHQQFNDLFKEWFSIIMEDEMLNVRLDDEFTPIVEQNGYDVDYSNLSGGERTSVALSYRLALNKVVNEVQSQIKTKDLLILDEPTDGFSTEQLDKVRTVLDELELGQVIIVSHESKIESFVENVVRIEKSEHVSRVVG